MSGSRRANDADQDADALPTGEGVRVALLAARFHGVITRRLLDGAIREAHARGVRAGDVLIEHVPGAFELPLAAKLAAGSGRFDAVVALGCVIRGETDHYRHVCDSAVQGLLRASLDTGVPVALGVLTVDDERQANARSGPGDDNKGAEAVRAALEMVHLARRLASWSPES